MKPCEVYETAREYSTKHAGNYRAMWADIVAHDTATACALVLYLRGIIMAHHGIYNAERFCRAVVDHADQPTSERRKDR